MTRPLSFRPAPARPALTITQILAWADAFHERFGRYPTRTDRNRGLPDTTWSAIDQCLKIGLRGLNAGSSLAQLLLAQRDRRHKGRLPRLTPKQILAWADDHHARTGEWPGQDSGPVLAAPRETWTLVNCALRMGRRGLPGGSSVAQLLTAQRGVRNHMTLPPFTLTQILAWADTHHTRTGQWPQRESGPILNSPGETWAAVNAALSRGLRGLPGGHSLAQLLQTERGVRNIATLPNLEYWEILAWADTYHDRTGRWPNAKSGSIPESSGETWGAVDSALWEGARGLPGGDSLTRLLSRRYGVPNPQNKPRLTHPQILGWADRHRQQTGRWPTRSSSAIPVEAGESWSAVHYALQSGCRGFPGGSSLAQLLDQSRGVRNRAAVPQLTLTQILEWADDHQVRTGRWPTLTTGPVTSASGETWSGVNAALRNGKRGLAGGQSLAQLLAEYRGKRNHLAQPTLTLQQILAWADAHHRHTSRWPVVKSGTIPDTSGQSWAAVDMALREGLRGLPGGESLARLLQRRRGVRNRNAPPSLTREQILGWMQTHYRRTGRWPRRTDGIIPQSGGESWSAVATALWSGLRGLPGGDSLAKLQARLPITKNRRV
jgi:hypothetical protein